MICSSGCDDNEEATIYETAPGFILVLEKDSCLLLIKEMLWHMVKDMLLC